MPVHRTDRESEEQTESDSSSCDPDELDGGVSGRKAAGHQSGNRELQCDERGRVVDETFTLENGNDASRHGETFEHAVAATASGGETIAPKAKAAAHGKPGTKAWAIQPTANVVIKTKPMARRRIGRRFWRKSRQEVVKATG